MTVAIPITVDRNSLDQVVVHETDPIEAAIYKETWERHVANQIASRKKNLKQQKDSKPFMISLVGIPGSGKTVSCLLLTRTLEEMGYTCMIMPHDGYHYTLDYLSSMEDAADKIYRRGAPDTFDSMRLLHDLRRIVGTTSKNHYHGESQQDEDETIIRLPAFDHAMGDPEPDKHIFDRNQHDIVICEGLYLLHPDWRGIPEIFDLKIFIDSDINTCMERLKIRNQCIPGYTPEEISTRVEAVDRVNAETVMKSKKYADIIVDSMAS